MDKHPRIGLRSRDVSMNNTIHRVVTGHNDQGESIILFDDQGTNHVSIESWPGLEITELWVTNESPANIEAEDDRSSRPLQHDPENGGTIFRLLSFPPESSGDDIDVDAVFEALGSENRPSDEMSSQHFSMHRTDSVDYLVVLSGEMWMVMDEGEVLLKPGSCVVQQGTNHAWVNKADKPCVLVAILVAADRPKVLS